MSLSKNAALALELAEARAIITSLTEKVALLSSLVLEAVIVDALPRPKAKPKRIRKIYSAPKLIINW